MPGLLFNWIDLTKQENLLLFVCAKPIEFRPKWRPVKKACPPKIKHRIYGPFAASDSLNFRLFETVFSFR